MSCKTCGKDIERYTVIGRSRRKTSNRRKNCFECVPHVVKAHPNLIEDYFSKIDSTEKAYLLGLLYADGGVNRLHTAIRLELSKKDEYLIDLYSNAVGANLEKKTELVRWKHGKQLHTVYLDICNKDFISHLVNAGCKSRKSSIISFHPLKDESINLAFLLGFYDGDGGRSVLNSGSMKFLCEVKEHFNIGSAITESNSNWGRVFRLYLPVYFLENMFSAFPGSLPRKRIVSHRVNRPHIQHEQPKKFDVTFEVLEYLVWSMPLVKVAELFGVSDTSVRKRCMKLGIVTPKMGYWNKR